MRVLFATTAGEGHVRPLVPFAHACIRAGHDVIVAGPPRAAPLAERARLAFRPVAAASREAIARFRAGQQGLAPAAAMARAFTDLYIGLHARAALPGMRTAIEAWRPDVVVRESAEVASMVAADRAGVPHAEVSIALSSQAAQRMRPLAAPCIDELRATVGLEPGGAPPIARLTLAPPSLDDPAPAPVRRFRAGAAASAPGDADPPLVYLSFGTEVPSPARSYFPALYRDAIDALADLPVRTLVTIGTRRDPADLGPVPRSVRVERWIPQEEVMREAVAMVTHGGAGSILAAAAAGVPMAIVPLFADQPFNAWRVAEIGAGLVLDDVADAGGAVRELLTDARFRDRARHVAAEIAALPPADDAVDVIGGFARA